MKIKVHLLILFLLFLTCNGNDKMIDMEIRRIIGVSMVTTNENGQAAEDLGKLWGRFYAEAGKIPGKKSDEIYAIYTDYESDYTGKYTAIVGYEVTSLKDVPSGFTAKEIGGGRFKKIVAKGEMPNAVMQAWKDIWEMDEELNRRYTADFEVYSEKSQNGKDSQVDIYLAVN